MAMLNSRPVRIPELRGDPAVTVPNGNPLELAQFLASHRRVLVITGAGCSTGSGIPAYRDPSGQWRRRQPIFYHDFLASATVRRRYWARSFFGWSVMAGAEPGLSHGVLARLGQSGRIGGLITQNVDGLHQRAGHSDVIELHGGLQHVICLNCGLRHPRDKVQQHLQSLNPDWSAEVLGIKPDGDAELDERAYPGFRLADCQRCGGVLKPDVVFFGESVPRDRLAAAERLMSEADALLVVGTSLVVWSGYRLTRQAAQAGRPVVAVNDGRTRADALLQFKISGDCGRVLADAERLLQQIKHQC
ncbi:MAG: NAD-dependent protein deacetylase [Xanthomonadaceae bacterium]|nr:NAD-dependent protein deacetylase [Xanthomonadaceae bacterium]